MRELQLGITFSIAQAGLVRRAALRLGGGWQGSGLLGIASALGGPSVWGWGLWGCGGATSWLRRPAAPLPTAAPHRWLPLQAGAQGELREADFFEEATQHFPPGAPLCPPACLPAAPQHRSCSAAMPRLRACVAVHPPACPTRLHAAALLPAAPQAPRRRPSSGKTTRPACSNACAACLASTTGEGAGGG